MGFIGFACSSKDALGFALSGPGSFFGFALSGPGSLFFLSGPGFFLQLLASNWLLASVMLADELVHLGQTERTTSVTGGPNWVDPTGQGSRCNRRPRRMSSATFDQ